MSNALIIVDVQNDFVEGGSLAVDGGVLLAERLAQKLNNKNFDNFDHIIYTQDWHIEPGDHFSENPDYKNSWPVHCVAETHGAEIVEPLKTALKNYEKTLVDSDRSVTNIRKGMFEASYSAFEGVTSNNQSLADHLHELYVKDVTVVGIAADFCVRATAFDAVKEGFKTSVWADYTVGIDDKGVERMFDKEFPAHNINVI